MNNSLLEYYSVTKKAILDTYDFISPFFSNFYSSKKVIRSVDFNQGIDARLINDHNMKRLSEICIRPLRIAFDHWSLHEVYEKAIRTAAKYGLKKLSNYVLYNFNDKPLELYWRLRLNIILCEELDVDIYSFPMKYLPISDPDYFKNRNFIGKYWSKKFIRTIQSILNSTGGKVGHSKDFFFKAFGKDEYEFNLLLYMPEDMIINRLFYENNGITQKWIDDYTSLSEVDRIYVNKIIESNIFTDDIIKHKNKRIENVLSYYLMKQTNICSCSAINS